LFWGLFGAVAPDMDYLYLGLFDSLNQNHHLYLTHYPFFWITLLLLSVLWLNLNRHSQNPVSAVLFSLGGLCHMFLDTIANQIYWLAPRSYVSFGLDELFETYAPSIEQNIPNWEYIFEYIIIVWALYLYLEHHWRSRMLTHSKDEA
jgi:inner membrane protein